MNTHAPELATVSADGLIEKLSAARTALTEATNDWQVLKVHRYAQTLRDIARAIRGYESIAIDAGALMVEAEVAIRDSNPAESAASSGRRGGQAGGRGRMKRPSEPSELDPGKIRKIRQAYKDLDDTEIADELASLKSQEIVPTREHFKKISRQKRQAATRDAHQATLTPTALPSDKYAVLLADPPWRYEFVETPADAIEQQYPTMPIESIRALPVPAHDESVLYLWATNPKLEDALSVIHAWGFTYKTNMVWVKHHIGMGYWSRAQHELVLIATRGSFSPPRPTDRISSVIQADRTEHSQKPVALHEMIETQFPTLKKIELFARTARPGWSVWGNQVGGKENSD